MAYLFEFSTQRNLSVSALYATNSVCVLAGAGPSDAPQPGSVEHGHQAVGGFREAGLPAAAALLPPRHLRQPAAALLQTRGTQQADLQVTGRPGPGRSHTTLPKTLSDPNLLQDCCRPVQVVGIASLWWNFTC